MVGWLDHWDDSFNNHNNVTSGNDGYSTPIAQRGHGSQWHGHGLGRRWQSSGVAVGSLLDCRYPPTPFICQGTDPLLEVLMGLDAYDHVVVS